MPTRIFPKAVLALALISSSALATEHEIKMLNQGQDGVMTFEPAFLSVQPGDTVTFVPTDVAHNTRSILSPENGTDWNGAPGKKVTVTLEQEGVYLYQCDPHFPLGMVGVIQVGQAKNLDAARKHAEALSGQIAVNKERLGRYLQQVQ